MIYDANGVATTYEYNQDGYFHDNKWLIKHLPWVDKIVDVGLFAKLIEGSMYFTRFQPDTDHFNYTEKSDSDYHASLLAWVAAILNILIGLVWIFCGGILIPLMMEAALYWRHSYYHLSDQGVAILFGVVTLVITYIWLVLMMVWGCRGLFLPLILVMGIVVYLYSIRKLGNIPHERCIHCRQMEMVHYSHTVNGTPYERWGKASAALESHVVERWKTWTEVTKRWSEPYARREKTYRENEQTHTNVSTRYADYDVLYRIYPSDKYYYCEACGQYEIVPNTSSTELKRVKKGEHTEEHVETHNE